MKEYILIDKQNIVRCIASLECNLHKDKIKTMKKYHLETKNFTVGDKYNPDTKKWSKHPENYPQLSEQDTKNKLISEKIIDMATKELIKEGKL